MRIAREKDGLAVLAEQADKVKSPFFCVGCNNKVFLHLEKNNRFFSHGVGEHCVYADENPIITELKINLFKYLQQQYGDIFLEKYYFGFKSDISFKFKEQIVSIDFFTLKTNKEYLYTKTESFTKNNIYILWITSEDLFKKRITEHSLFSLDSELFIQSLYINKIFLLTKNNLFTSVYLSVLKSYFNKKINEEIHICKPVFSNPRLFKSFFLKEEFPYKGKGMIRKILTAYVAASGGSK